MTLLEKIQKNKITQPTHRSFRIQKWAENLQEYLEEKNNIVLKNLTITENRKEFEDDKIHFIKTLSIYAAGINFHSYLEEVRNELSNLYKNENPFSNIEEMIKFYFSVSNRNKKVLLDNLKESSDFSSNTICDNNFLNNELTADDIANGSVDGVSIAIKNCISMLDKNTKLKISSNPISKLHFTKKESFLSELYNSLENYWNLIVLLNYEFHTEKDKNYNYIIEPESDYHIISLVSNQRREKIVAQRAYIAMSDEHLIRYIKKYKYIKKSKAFQIKKIIEDENISFYYLSLLSQKAFLSDFIPDELMNEKYNNCFSIQDILRVFEQLSLLAIQFNDEYINDDIREYESEKLLNFCPILKKTKLIKSLCDITGFTFLKVEKILCFLEYNGNKNDDLWVNPIFPISKSEYILLTSAIDSPNLLRTIEKWIVKLDFSLEKRGDYYENLIVSEFNKVLDNNENIVDFNKAVSKKIKLKNKKDEQIDFLSRIGNKILLGETKCIITSDSPQREYNTYQRLKEEASVQVNRKKEFIEQDLENVFEVLEWDYNPNYEYEVITFIINSNRTLVGLSIDNIPIIDKEILLNYFRKNKFSILSMEKDNEIVDIAYFILYNNLKEMYENINIYLKNPPPIIIKKDSFKRSSIEIPILNEKAPRLFFSRLISVDLRPEEVFEKEYPFKIEKAEFYDEYISKADFFM
jgi:hypothetical protein